MMHRLRLLRFPIFLTAFLTGGSLAAQTATWTNAGADNSFSNAANWSPASIPGTGAALVLTTSDLLGLDLGTAYTAGSITVDPGLTASIAPAGAETLTLTGGLTLFGGSTLELTLPFLVSGTQSWALNSGTLTTSAALNFTAGTATVALGSGATFVFGAAAANPDWLGTLAFTGTAGATSLSVTGAGLTAQNLSRITVNGQPVQLAGGYLVAIPEPSTYVTILGLAALAIAARKHRTANRLF